MSKEPNDMARLESYTKYDAGNAPVKKYGGNKAIHDGIVTEGSQYAPKRKGEYERGQGKLAEAPEN